MMIIESQHAGARPGGPLPGGANSVKFKFTVWGTPGPVSQALPGSALRYV
jgi:hypothetical protein